MPNPEPFIHRKNARARSVSISLASDGTVVVTTPPRFPARLLPMYVSQASEWIEEHRTKLQSKPQLLTNTSVFVFGKEYEIKVGDSFDGTVKLGTANITLNPVSPGSAHARLLLEKWLITQAREYVLTRVGVLAKKMGVTFADVRFKQQKTRWGSCSSDKNLNFNWKLIHAPKEVIDYVIIHELAHTEHMNHGTRFWEFVAKFDPDHPLHRGWLKRYGSTED